MADKTVLFEKKSDCCGCGACENVCAVNAITMKADPEGFFYPEINHEVCVRCGQCVKVCPFARRKAEENAQHEKKHIKIVNLFTSNNYGASIGAAMLEKAVRGIVPEDVIVETLNYRHEFSKGDFMLYHKEYALDMESWAKYFEFKLFPKYPSAVQKAEMNARRQKFFMFHDAFINATIPVNNRDLKNDRDNNAALIAGSDVIWHTKRVQSQRSAAYFLGFGGKNARRIAYAPGIDRKTDLKLKRLKKLYSQRLAEFDHISVREEQSRKFISKCTDKKVYRCCDPVLLFCAEDYDEIISTAEVRDCGEKYIYAYVLDNNDYIVDYVKKLAADKGLKICFFAPNYSDFGENAVNCNTDGPAEFLYRLKNAEYVVTTSYHCAVFSLLFEKKFLSFERSKTSIKTPDLLSLVGLRDRIVYGENAGDIDSAIDFGAVKSIIAQFRDESLDYLKNALDNI